jgi:hypothetical protein
LQRALALAEPDIENFFYHTECSLYGAAITLLEIPAFWQSAWGIVLSRPFLLLFFAAMAKNEVGVKGGETPCNFASFILLILPPPPPKGDTAMVNAVR